MKKEYTLRHPVVNGLFYPDDKSELENTVSGYIEKIDKQELYSTIREQTGFDKPEEVLPEVLIVPHAGYIFSGKVKAYSYCLLEDKTVDTVVIVGPAHQRGFKGISVNLDNAYKTPLGIIEVDLDFADKLASYHEAFKVNEEAHLSEHAIEVQLPFIQTVLKGSKIVPVLFGEQNWENSELLKNALVSSMNEVPKNYVVIVSSDLSHYHPHVEALSFDTVLIEDVKKLNATTFYDHIQSGKSEACGFGGILTGVMLSNELGKAKSVILHYMDSGEVSGDRKKVVGYLAAALY
jgi:AmmeMemoRadiSam system protein B